MRSPIDNGTLARVRNPFLFHAVARSLASHEPNDGVGTMRIAFDGIPTYTPLASRTRRP